MNDVGSDINDSGNEFDDSNIEVNWENAEEDLIPVDRSHFSQDILEAEARADEELNAQEAALDSTIREIEAESDIQAASETGEQAQNDIDDIVSERPYDAEDNLESAANVEAQTLEQIDDASMPEIEPDSQLNSGTEIPQAVDTPETGRFATTELGYSRMIETGPENPERTVWNDIESKD